MSTYPPLLSSRSQPQACFQKKHMHAIRVFLVCRRLPTFETRNTACPRSSLLQLPQCLQEENPSTPLESTKLPKLSPPPKRPAVSTKVSCSLLLLISATPPGQAGPAFEPAHGPPPSPPPAHNGLHRFLHWARSG